MCARKLRCLLGWISRVRNRRNVCWYSIGWVIKFRWTKMFFWIWRRKAVFYVQKRFIIRHGDGRSMIWFNKLGRLQAFSAIGSTIWTSANWAWSCYIRSSVACATFVAEITDCAVRVLCSFTHDVFRALRFLHDWLGELRRFSHSQENCNDEHAWLRVKGGNT